MKFILQLIILLCFACFAPSLYAIDSLPPGTPAGAPVTPAPAPAKETIPPVPSDPAEPPAKRSRKREAEDANKTPDEPDDWEPITRGTQALQIPRVGCLVRSEGGTAFVPGVKVCDGKLVPIH